jgi:hypothetical protein
MTGSIVSAIAYKTKSATTSAHAPIHTEDRTRSTLSARAQRLGLVTSEDVEREFEEATARQRTSSSITVPSAIRTSDRRRARGST